MKTVLISDCDVLDQIEPEDLWVIDKFILSKRSVSFLLTTKDCKTNVKLSVVTFSLYLYS